MEGFLPTNLEGPGVRCSTLHRTDVFSRSVVGSSGELWITSNFGLPYAALLVPKKRQIIAKYVMLVYFLLIFTYKIIKSLTCTLHLGQYTAHFNKALLGKWPTSLRRYIAITSLALNIFAQLLYQHVIRCKSHDKI